jgi:hypothetical protein
MKIYLLALIVLLHTSLFGQKTTTIHYYFPSKTIKDCTDLNNLKEGDFYRIQIDSINLNLYRVELASKDSSVYKPIEFTRLTSGVSSLSELFKNARMSLQSISLPTEMQDVLNYPDEKGIGMNNLNNIDTSLLTRANLIKYQLALYQRNFNTLSHKGKEQSETISSIESAISLKMKKARLKNVGLSEVIRIEYVDTLEVRFPKITADVDSVLKDYSIEKTNFENFLKEIDAKDTIGVLKDIKAVEKSVSDIGEALNKLKSNSRKTKFDKHISLLYDYVNNSDPTFRSMPIQLTKDITHVEFSIIPIDSGSRLPSYTTRLKLPSKQYWYWAIGTAGYVSGLYDENYSQRGVQINDSTVNYSIVNEADMDKNDTTKFINTREWGAAINLKVGYKLPCYPDLGLHISIGSGFSFAKEVRPRIMLGGGVSYGHKHRLTLGGGFIGGNTFRLSKAYELNDVLPQRAESLTISKFQHSWYASLGYVFTL